MYNIRPTTKFQKDLKRVKKRGFDIPLLTDIIKKLAAGEPLPEKNRDHQLSWQLRSESGFTQMPHDLFYLLPYDFSRNFPFCQRLFCTKCGCYAH